MLWHRCALVGPWESHRFWLAAWCYRWAVPAPAVSYHCQALLQSRVALGPAPPEQARRPGLPQREYCALRTFSSWFLKLVSKESVAFFSSKMSRFRRKPFQFKTFAGHCHQKTPFPHVGQGGARQTHRTPSARESAASYTPVAARTATIGILVF